MLKGRLLNQHEGLITINNHLIFNTHPFQAVNIIFQQFDVNQTFYRWCKFWNVMKRPKVLNWHQTCIHQQTDDLKGYKSHKWRHLFVCIAIFHETGHFLLSQQCPVWRSFTVLKSNKKKKNVFFKKKNKLFFKLKLVSISARLDFSHHTNLTFL